MSDSSDIIQRLNDIIAKRKTDTDPTSYTVKLFSNGENMIIKKLGEENAEFIKAFLTEGSDSIISESADYIYHLMVALRFRDIDFSSVLDELARRYNS